MAKFCTALENSPLGLLVPVTPNPQPPISLDLLVSLTSSVLLPTPRLQLPSVWGRGWLGGAQGGTCLPPPVCAPTVNMELQPGKTQGAASTIQQAGLGMGGQSWVARLVIAITAAGVPMPTVPLAAQEVTDRDRAVLPSLPPLLCWAVALPCHHGLVTMITAPLSLLATPVPFWVQPQPEGSNGVNPALVVGYSCSPECKRLAAGDEGSATSPYSPHPLLCALLAVWIAQGS